MSWSSKRIGDVLNARQFPIRIYIGALFIVLILAVGFCIGLYNYRENTDVLLKTGTVLTNRARQETRLTVDQLFSPIQMLVNVLSQQQLTRATTLAQRLDSLPYMIEALNQHEPLSALYIGYQNGDFFMVQALRTDRQRREWKAPAAAEYAVRHIDRHDPAAPIGTYLYYDASAHLIEQRRQPEHAFDPRVRPWYRQALQTTRMVLTEPYVFFTAREPGITLTRRASTGGSVVGADIKLAELAELLVNVKMSPSAELMLLDTRENVLAYSNAGGTGVAVKGDKLRLPRLDEFKQSVLASLMRQPPTGQAYSFMYHHQPWLGSVDQFLIADSRLLLAVAAPRAELLQDAERVRRNEVMLTVLILLLSMPAAWLAGYWISRPLQRLATHTRVIAAFDFGKPIPRSWINEVDQLACSMDGMQSTISHFLDLSASLSSARKLPNLLKQVLAESAGALQASGGGIYLYDDSEKKCDFTVSHGKIPVLPHSFALRIEGSNGEGTAFADLCCAAIRSGVPKRLAWPDVRHTSIVIPLFNRDREAVGIVALFVPVAIDALSREAIGFVEALSGTAAITIEAQRALDSSKALLQSLVQLIAAAIDAKSPYTGGHCQRVPVIAKMLARAACESSDGPLKGFQLSEEDWESLHLGAWLHDCGKVTTPEYVVDKATKLEMLYDRIHEVRMRFEVLKRDADIAYWKGVACGGDRARLAAEREETWRMLDDDFSFIAQCNVGGESMSSEQMERVKQIGRRIWMRTLDDRIGISFEEWQRKARTPAPTLPVTESLLGDRDDHLVERLPQDRMPADNPWGFKLEVPKYKYNHGEIYNLCVSRGTLSEEERYKINDHVAQTYIMLSKLPFPRSLRAVPDIAGSHHERIDGSGYPRRLRKEQMSMPARMVAIADIFEALTAADRPYKPGKPLSETLALMARMRDERHIDADLFGLFLRSGVYLDYARQYLKPEQIDVDNIEQFLSFEKESAAGRMRQ